MGRLLSESLEVCGIFQKMIMKPIWYSSTSLHTVYIYTYIYIYPTWITTVDQGRVCVQNTNMIKYEYLPWNCYISSPKVSLTHVISLFFKRNVSLVIVSNGRFFSPQKLATLSRNPLRSMVVLWIRIDPLAPPLSVPFVVLWTVKQGPGSEGW